MLVRLSPHRAIYRHAQTNGTSCGRAAAQMIISSIVQSPIAPKAGPPDATPVPVSQLDLQSREADTPIPPDVPGLWSTHPDEMVALLKNAPELKGLPHHTPAKWRIVTRTSHPAIVTELILSLQRGMPAVVSINQWDHWATVVEMGIDGSVLEFVEMYDPIPQKAGFSHTYKDACRFRSDGTLWNWELTGIEFGGYSLQQGPLPPPPGMINYAGKFLAIIYDAASDTDRRDAERKRVKKPKAWRGAGPPPRHDPKELTEDIRLRAAKWTIEDVTALFHESPPVITRLVKDMDSDKAASQYTLLSMFSVSHKSGLLAVFNAAGSLLHFRMANDDAIHQSLAANDQTLWWTRGYMPTLASPYFPFRRQQLPDRIRYTRVYDNYVIDAPLAPLSSAL